MTAPAGRGESAGPASTAVLPIARGATVTIASALPMFLVGALVVQIRAELDFSAAGLGILITTFLVLSGVLSVPAGHLVERIGASAGMRLAPALSGGASLSIAATATSFRALLLWMAVASIGNSVSYPAVNLYLTRAVPITHQGKAFGIRQAALPASTLLGGLAVPALALTVGWRWAFVSGAVLALLAIASVPSLPHRRAARDGTARDGRLTGRPRRVAMLLAFAMGLGFACHTNLGAFTVSAAVDAGFAEGSAGLLLACGSTLSVLTRVIVGSVADRRGERHLELVTLMLLAGAGGYLLLAAGTVPAMIAGTVLTFTLAWGWAGVFMFAAVRLFPSAVGAVTGVIQTGGFIGAAAGPLAFGIVVEQLSYAVAWTGVAVGTVAAAAVIGVTARTVRPAAA